jgi:hypothetical protein
VAVITGADGKPEKLIVMALGRAVVAGRDVAAGGSGSRGIVAGTEDVEASGGGGNIGGKPVAE